MIEVEDRVQFVVAEELPEFVVIPEQVTTPQVRGNFYSRREFLAQSGLVLGKIILGGSLIGVMVGCESPQSTDSTFPLPSLKEPSRPFDEISLRDSSDFVIKEIQSHSKLGSLKEYDPKRLNEFIGHAYNIWAKITNSHINPDILLSKTTIGKVNDIQKAHQDYQKGLGLTARFSSDKSDVSLGITYSFHGNLDDLRIIVNQDHNAYLPEGFNLDSW